MLDEEMVEALVASDDGRLRYRVSRSAVVAAYGEMAPPAGAPDVVPRTARVRRERHR